MNNRPDYLDNDPLIHWQSQEEFFKDILTPRPPVGPDDAKNHCHNCGCEIEKTGTLARCNECNVKHAAKANTRANESTLCKKCGKRQRLWVRGRHAGLCIDCAKEHDKDFKGWK